MQEHHDLADHLLVRPGRRESAGPLRPNPFDLAQPLRAGLDDVEHVLAEQPDHALRVDRSNAPDHAGAEVFLDAFQRRGGGDLQETRAELQAVSPVVGPFPRGGDPFAGRDHRGVAHRGDEITLAAGLDAQHAEAVFRVVERYPLDEAGKHLAAARQSTPLGRATIRRSVRVGIHSRTLHRKTLCQCGHCCAKPAAAPFDPFPCSAFRPGMHQLRTDNQRGLIKNTGRSACQASRGVSPPLLPDGALLTSSPW